MEPSPMFYLPDLVARWPWSRNLNTHYDEMKSTSSSCSELFCKFPSNVQKAFKNCDYNLFAALAYPIATKEQLKNACDLIGFFLVLDESSDFKDEGTVQDLMDVVMDALRHPDEPRPLGEPLHGEAARQFWKRAFTTAKRSSQARFLETFHTYCQAVVQQAADRSSGRLRGIQDYLQVRRGTIGVRPSFVLFELEVDLPDQVVEHHALDSLVACAVDMTILANDLYSYNVEQARGDAGHNIVAITMNELHTDLGGAIKWIKEYNDLLVDQFLAHFDKLPSWDPEIDVQVLRYVNGMANWIRANDAWSFESQRYFGSDGLVVQESRWVALLPRVDGQ